MQIAETVGCDLAKIYTYVMQIDKNMLGVKPLNTAIQYTESSVPIETCD
jgi:hypothetical protein